ncbi:kinase-like domain-containing protein [Aspergillus candidus]|uniref:non-specific serine/threonine protein kinase n=1 Tax=Aspergillus candidus TaxID=41067 RepID=A0A2I2FBB6_ASPCN|nr:kinase-like domain-containing protein [Aspergillus candidus]PLB37916.1 kinase-like domain-containing protein [Aspergillus candidus]
MADLRSSTPRVFPTHIGEILNHRYQIVGKLGYGSSATVWLCRDLRMHTCLVHLSLGNSLDQLTLLLPGQVMTSAMVRTTMRNILAALDFLHTKAGVITNIVDLQPNNILLGIKDDSILLNFEQAEFDAPTPRKTLEDRTIYVTRPLPISPGTPVLCDLGEARVRIAQQRVVLDMNWDYKVDIWKVGMVIWDLMERHHLFKARSPDHRLDDGVHLGEMHALLGCPPREFLSRSEKSLQYWHENGQWNGAAPLPDYNLESWEENLHGDEQSDFSDGPYVGCLKNGPPPKSFSLILG